MARRFNGLRIDPSDLALEVVSIVIAILLATVVGQAVENYRAGVRTHQALARICQEIARDDARLEAPAKLHEAVRGSFAAALRSARGERLSPDAFGRAFAAPAPEGFHPFSGTSIAWTLAQNSNEIATVPYDVRSVLQTRYAEVEDLERNNVSVVTDVEVAPTDDRPNFYFVASSLAAVLGDVVASEARLRSDDAAALDVLRRSGDC